ncbi:MAG: hypothetical protein ABIR32_13685, partial [Ilumatobacteraceae bacterium]
MTGRRRPWSRRSSADDAGGCSWVRCCRSGRDRLTHRPNPGWVEPSRECVGRVDRHCVGIESIRRHDGIRRRVRLRDHRRAHASRQWISRSRPRSRRSRIDRSVRDSRSVVILESTTYPGTTADVLAPILDKESGPAAGVDFFVGFSSERIDPGNATWNLPTTPKLVSGINSSSRESTARLGNQQLVSGINSSSRESTARLGNQTMHPSSDAFRST